MNSKRTPPENQKRKRYSPTPSLPALRRVCALLGNVAASLAAQPILMQTAAVGHVDSHAHSGVRLSARDWTYQVAIKDQLWRRDATRPGATAESSDMSSEATSGIKTNCVSRAQTREALNPSRSSSGCGRNLQTAGDIILSAS